MTSEDSERLPALAIRFAAIATSDKRITCSICRIRTNDMPSMTYKMELNSESSVSQKESKASASSFSSFEKRERSAENIIPQTTEAIAPENPQASQTA